MIDHLCQLALNDDQQGPVALATLVRLALDSAQPQWRETPYGIELLSRFTADEEAASPLAELPSDPEPTHPFAAWRLSWRAMDASADSEHMWLDRAIDAFAAIVDAPRDPGNDLGPFTLIAQLLDEPQLRRAAGILSAMTSWPHYERSHAWAALAERFAELGELDAADDCVGNVEAVDIKAIAAGCVAGERARRGHAPLTTPLLPLPQYLDGITRRLVAPQDEHVQAVWAWLTAAPADEHALRALWPWFAFGASERWLSFMGRLDSASPCCTDMLFELAAVSRDPRAAERAVHAALADDEPATWLDELYEARHAFTFAAWRRALVQVLAAAAGVPTVHTLGTLARTRQLALLLEHAGVAPVVALDVLRGHGD